MMSQVKPRHTGSHGSSVVVRATELKSYDVMHIAHVTIFMYKKHNKNRKNTILNIRNGDTVMAITGDTGVELMVIDM